MSKPIIRFPQFRAARIAYMLLNSLIVYAGSSVVCIGEEPVFVDCSLLVAPEYPATWPTAPFPEFQITHQRTIGPYSNYNIDVLLIDGNTGTQLDVPPHSVARPDLNRPKSGPLGLAYTDKIEPWQFGGEACVIDVREMLDRGPKGESPLITTKEIERFERQHRKLRFGDVVLFRSDYSDRYYQPFPAGSRYIADALDRKSPGYPDPNPECMELLGSRGVLTLGTDSASMGPLPDLAEPTHYAGLKYGMIWTEGSTSLGQLPATGAFYCILAPKHENGPYSEARAFAIVDPDLAERLISSCKNKRAIDLSPTLASSMPLTSPGVGTGRHRQSYLKIDFLYSDYLDMWHHTHMMDSMAGTHLVPPAYSLPSDNTPIHYSPEARGWLEEYEKQYGPRGTSTMTTEQVPLAWTCGEAKVIDVTSLAGSTRPDQWPASPEITPALISAYEHTNGALQAGDIVLFRTGFVDNHLHPQPGHENLWINPLGGHSEGWPAPGPDAIVYLKEKGIRCIATDAPDIGGVDPRRALMTYWAMGSREMVGVEFLQNLASVSGKSTAYFLFAAVKIRDCHGGPGRAIVLY